MRRMYQKTMLNARDYESLIQYLRFCRWILPFSVFTDLSNNEGLDWRNSMSELQGDNGSAIST